MKIQGIEENIYIELKLLNLKLEKSLFESFIPFELAINIREEKYEFKKDGTLKTDFNNDINEIDIFNYFK